MCHNKEAGDEGILARFILKKKNPQYAMKSNWIVSKTVSNIERSLLKRHEKHLQYSESDHLITMMFGSSSRSLSNIAF